MTPDWIVDSIQANQLLPEEEYAPLVSTSPSRFPLKPYNAQQTTNQINVQPSQEAAPSTFITPASTTSPVSLPPSDLGGKPNTPVFVENKENASNGGAVLPTTEARSEERSELLKGFVLHFTDYEERLSSETFTIWKVIH